MVNSTPPSLRAVALGCAAVAILYLPLVILQMFLPWAIGQLAGLALACGLFYLSLPAIRRMRLELRLLPTYFGVSQPSVRTRNGAVAGDGQKKASAPSDSGLPRAAPAKRKRPGSWRATKGALGFLVRLPLRCGAASSAFTERRFKPLIILLILVLIAVIWRSSQARRYLPAYGKLDGAWELDQQTGKIVGVVDGTVIVADPVHAYYSRRPLAPR